MNNLKLITTENFEEVTPCDFWADINDEYFLTREQIGRALGYNNPTKAISFVNDLEEFLSAFNVKGIAQYKIDDKYRIDYYIPDLKIAIEYDESGHKDYDREKERMREEYIKNKLGCKFIRVPDDNSDIKNIGIITKELYNYVQ